MANDADLARSRAIAAHDEAWTLLEKEGRNAEESARMIGAAHASLKAWEEAGGPVEAQRGNWLVARCYAAAGIAAAAQEYARRTARLTAAHRPELADYDLAFAEEISARAAALSGDMIRAKDRFVAATALGEAISDAGDRAEFFRQLAVGPWFGADE